MSIRDGPSEEDGLLFNITDISTGTRGLSYYISAPRQQRKRQKRQHWQYNSESAWIGSKHCCYFSLSDLCPLISATHLSWGSTGDAWNIITEKRGCLFTICIQSRPLDTVPCSFFSPPKPQRDTCWRFHFWTLSRRKPVPPYQISLTITDSLRQSCCLTYPIPEENPAPASRETSASRRQLMMSTGPCSYQIPPALSIIPCEITAIGYYCTNYDHVSRCHKA